MFVGRKVSRRKSDVVSVVKRVSERKREKKQSRTSKCQCERDEITKL